MPRTPGPRTPVPRIADAARGIAALERLVRGLARILKRLAIATGLALIPIAAALARDGLDGGELVLLALLVAAPAIVLFLANGIGEVADFPDRLRRLPAEGQQRIADVARAGGELRGARVTRLPLVLWRLRGAVGSVRDVTGIAVRLRALTPGFLGLSAVAAGACVVICVIGLITLVALATG